MNGGFSGSYLAEDVTFLLTPLTLAPTPMDEKERLIQSGQRHYSEMISWEDPPSPEYLALFHDQYQLNRQRLIREILALALSLAERRPPVVLVSLARAGTPIGILVRRALIKLSVEAQHFSISIIRGRGIDQHALDIILKHFSAEQVIFLDGWVGKGAIAEELRHSIRAYNINRGTCLPEDLTVLTDLAGEAALAVSQDDWLIPSAILNAIVSGLVSRTIVPHPGLPTGHFHGCIMYRHLEKYDLSRWFIEDLVADFSQVGIISAARPWSVTEKLLLQERSQQFVAWVMNRYHLPNQNLVKPGIGEATRALMRRVPDRLLLKNLEDPNLIHLLHLAQKRNVPYEIIADLPYRAAVVIKTCGD